LRIFVSQYLQMRVSSHDQDLHEIVQQLLNSIVYD